jgi:hypothetical protein
MLVSLFLSQSLTIYDYSSCRLSVKTLTNAQLLKEATFTFLRLPFSFSLSLSLSFSLTETHFMTGGSNGKGVCLFFAIFAFWHFFLLLFLLNFTHMDLRLDNVKSSKKLNQEVVCTCIIN